MTTRRLVAVSMTLAVVMVVSALHSIAGAAEGDATFGGQWWDQTVRDAKFQEFREVPRGGLLESFLLREWSGRNSFALWGANGLRDDQATRLTVSNGVRWRADLGFTQIPHTFSHLARWGWTQTSPGVFTLPDTLQQRNQTIPGTYTQRMTDFLGSAPVVGLGFNTGISTARLRARPARGWQFETRGTLRERSGLKPYAMSFGFSTALENPEPIDQRMVDADLIANYQRKDLKLQASGGVSVFDNAISTLFVDNPKRYTDINGGDGAKVGALDLYPDNQVVRGSVALGYMLPRRSAFAATVGVSQGKQDDEFLPFTNNKALGPSSLDSLPAKNADAKATQINGDLRLTTNLMDDLDAAVRFHYSDYDNQTPERQFYVRVPYDASVQRFGFTSATDHTNHALSNTQWQGALDLDYAVSPKVKVGATAEYRERERTEREVEKDNETVLSGRARLRPMDEVQIDAHYWHGDRQLDKFLEEDYEGLRTRLAAGSNSAVYDSIGQLEQPDLRRFDVADRVQDRASAGVSYAFGERADVSATYSYLKNDYKDSKIGLVDETEHTVASNATVHVNERLDLNGGYGFGLAETNQNSRQSGTSIPSSNPLDNWAANLKDTDVFVAAGFEWWPRPEKLSLSADYQFSRHIEDFDLNNATNTAQDVPSTLYRRHDVVVDTRYRWLKNMTIIGRYAWEEYDVDDFAVTNVPLIFPVTGASSAIFLGDSSAGYKAHRVALLAKWTF